VEAIASTGSSGIVTSRSAAEAIVFVVFGSSEVVTQIQLPYYLFIGCWYLEQRDSASGKTRSPLVMARCGCWLPELKRSLLVQQIVSMEQLLKLYIGRRSLKSEGRYETVLIQLYQLDKLMDEYAQYDTRNSRLE